MKRFLVCTVAALAVLSLGLVLNHCGGSDDEKQCETNEECPEGYWCDRTVWECKKTECIPNCTGKCCGDNGCDDGKTCPDNCPTGHTCNATSCVCEATSCQTNADCTATQCCKTGACTDMACGDRVCGPDPVCGKDCGECQAGTHCDQGACDQDVACTEDAGCDTDECCIGDPKVCTAMTCGDLECGPDPTCGKECGPCTAPEVCNDDGMCETGAATGSCPAGQECTQMTDSGAMACVIPPNNTIPDTNQTDCDGVGCDGNYTCYCLDANCDTSACIEMCGECPAGMECCELMGAGGPMGCLTAGCTGLPANPPACGENNPCQGNATCYQTGADDLICIDNCSVDHSPCNNGDVKCSGDTVQTCANNAWVDTTDCTATSLVCKDGACVTPAGLGEFCEDLKCETGLDCVGFQGGTHSFCTPQCDCENQTGCDTDWECMFSDQDPDAPTCWCGKTCPNNDPATDCPNNGTGWTCEETEPDSGEYFCMIQ